MAGYNTSHNRFPAAKERQCFLCADLQTSALVRHPSPNPSSRPFHLLFIRQRTDDPQISARVHGCSLALGLPRRLVSRCAYRITTRHADTAVLQDSMQTAARFQRGNGAVSFWRVGTEQRLMDEMNLESIRESLRVWEVLNCRKEVLRGWNVTDRDLTLLILCFCTGPPIFNFNSDWFFTYPRKPQTTATNRVGKEENENEMGKRDGTRGNIHKDT